MRGIDQSDCETEKGLEMGCFPLTLTMVVGGYLFERG